VGAALGDISRNVAAFVPLGYLWQRRLRHTRLGFARAGALVVAGAALFALGVETAQHFLPGRYSSLSDVISNMAGAAIGVALTPRGRFSFGWLA
jgi:VanZ family protein